MLYDSLRKAKGICAIRCECMYVHVHVCDCVCDAWLVYMIFQDDNDGYFQYIMYDVIIFNCSFVEVRVW